MPSSTHSTDASTCPVVRLAPDELDFSSIPAQKRIHGYRHPFPKSDFYTRFARLDPVITENVFSTTDVEYHSRHRRLLSAPLSESSLKAVEGIVTGRIDVAIQKIGEEMKSRGAADVMKWFLFMSTDIIGELTFGDSFRMLEQGRSNQYVVDLHKIASIGGMGLVFPRLFKLASHLPIPAVRHTFALFDRMQSYSEESIQRYKNIVAADPWNPKPTLFTKLFRAEGESLSQAEIVASARAYIIAGSDTTAHSLTYLVWAMCKDDVLKRSLVDEVAALRDGYGDEELKGLPFLNQVIKETLRLYAAAPAGLPRETPPGGCAVDGTWVPGGTTVTTQAFSMHRDPVVYPDPERFNPLRWENPTKEMKDAWVPFGAGARICLGLHLAEMELRKGTANFFRTFPNAKVSKLEGFSDDDMEQVIYFLMFPKNKRCLIQGS